MKKNGVEFLFRRRGVDIGFYFGNEVLELGRIAIGMEKFRKTVENFRVEERIGGRKPGVFDVWNGIDFDG